MRSAPILLLLLACGDDGEGDSEPTCVPDLDPACAPLYEPTFDAVYTNTIEPTCTQGGCHDADFAAGGLDMATADDAYANLVDAGRVVPGDAACSTLMKRLEGHELDVMPPGAQLDDAERCAVQQWIDAGAEP